MIYSWEYKDGHTPGRDKKIPRDHTPVIKQFVVAGLYASSLLQANLSYSS